MSRRSRGRHTVMYRVFATDLDGTLLPSEYGVPQRTVRAIAALQEAGALVVPITARSPRTTAPICREFGISGTAICGNGAIVYDVEAGRIVERRALDGAIARRMIEALRAAAPGVLFGCEVDMRFAHEPGYEPAIRVPADLLSVGDALELVADGVAKLVARHPGMDHELLMKTATEVADEHVRVGTSGGSWIEIQAAGVTKGAALAAICAERGVDASETVAFGDHDNDIPMLQWAGHAVVPENGTAGARAVADEVCPSNDAEGVAEVMERLLSDGLVAPA